MTLLYRLKSKRQKKPRLYRRGFFGRLPKGNCKEFQRMLDDCRAGKVDMIITKSITRFARNTLTTLEAVRELKLLGIDAYFEKERIHSISGDGELMLSILASFAQEESHSVSENCKWHIRKMFCEGRLPTGRMLGYRLTDGKLHIVPEEAVIVRQIFADYLSDMGKIAIARKLNEAGIPTKHGGPWSENTVAVIIRNEKYAGNMMLQKTYVEDHLSKKKVRNRQARGEALSTKGRIPKRTCGISVYRFDPVRTLWQLFSPQACQCRIEVRENCLDMSYL